MRLPYHRQRTNFIRRFPERTVRWCRTPVGELTPIRLGDGFSLRRFELPSPLAAARGRRIAFISDLHYHGTAVEERRIAALAETLGSFRPDLLLSGGDITGDACDLPGMTAVLGRLSASAAVSLAVCGNWERGKHWLGVDFWREVYAEGGFELLCNEYRTTGCFTIYGEDDLIHGIAESPPPPPAGDRLRIILTHRPDAVIADDDGVCLDPFFLALCGHTHGGQWRLPLAGAFYVPSFYYRRFDRGWFRRSGSGMMMFVSVGAGELSLRGRLCCPREAVLIELS